MGWFASALAGAVDQALVEHFNYQDDLRDAAVRLEPPFDATSYLRQIDIDIAAYSRDSVEGAAAAVVNILISGHPVLVVDDGGPVTALDLIAVAAAHVTEVGGLPSSVLAVDSGLTDAECQVALTGFAEPRWWVWENLENVAYAGSRARQCVQEFLAAYTKGEQPFVLATTADLHAVPRQLLPLVQVVRTSDVLLTDAQDALSVDVEADAADEPDPHVIAGIVALMNASGLEASVALGRANQAAHELAANVDELLRLVARDEYGELLTRLQIGVVQELHARCQA